MSRTAARADSPGLIPDHELREMERVAVDLARLAGTEIQSAFGSLLAVKYKDEPRE